MEENKQAEEVMQINENTTEAKNEMLSWNWIWYVIGTIFFDSHLG